MKVFISQPMNDNTDENIMSERKCAMLMLHDKYGNVEEIDSFFKDAPHDAKPLWYLGESIKLIGDADLVYMCKDWQKYRGCTIEHECAVRYGKTIEYA